MARRRSDEPPVSLFSFQDIITAISGIMLFVALLMVLDLTSAVGGSPQVVRQGPSRDDLRRQEEGLQQMLRATEQEVAQLANRTRGLSGVDVYQDRKEVADRRSALRELTRRLAAQRDLLEDQQRRAQGAAEQVRTIQEVGIEERKLGPLIEQGVTLRRQLGKTGDERRQLEAARGRRVSFALPGRESSRSVILVECAADMIYVRPLDGDETPQVIRERAQKAREYRVARALASYPPEKNDVLVIVKPSAFSSALDLVQSIKDIGYEVGWEPLEDNRTTMGH